MDNRSISRCLEHAAPIASAPTFMAQLSPTTSSHMEPTDTLPNGVAKGLPNGIEERLHKTKTAHYSPPWSNTSMIGVAGSSGSGKTSLAYAIIRELSLPWVVIMSMDSFYKPLNPEQSRQAFNNEYDFDAPEAIDFDILVNRLRDIKQG